MDLTKKILEVGVENCLFLVPMRKLNTIFGLLSYTSSSDPEIIVSAKINEDRYKVNDNYKITLKSIYEGFETKHYYISDLKKLIIKNEIEFYIKPENI